MSNLLKSLPPRYANCGQITRLLRTLQLELAHLEQEVQAVATRGLIAQADEAGLSHWENDLGLPHRPDLTLEGRRAILHAALDRAYRGTVLGLTTYVQNLSGSANAQVQQDYASFRLTLTTQGNNLVDFGSLQHWVCKRLPIHVTSEFIRASGTEAQSAVENS